MSLVSLSVCVQALQAKATSQLVQALLTSEAGQDGMLQGIKQALANKPQLREALATLLQDKAGHQDNK